MFLSFNSNTTVSPLPLLDEIVPVCYDFFFRYSCLQYIYLQLHRNDVSLGLLFFLTAAGLACLAALSQSRLWKTMSKATLSDYPLGSEIFRYMQTRMDGTRFLVLGMIQGTGNKKWYGA